MPICRRRPPGRHHSSRGRMWLGIVLSLRRALAPDDDPVSPIRSLWQVFDLAQCRAQQCICPLPCALGVLDIFRVGGSACLREPLIGGCRIGMCSAPLFHCAHPRISVGLGAGYAEAPDQRPAMCRYLPLSASFSVRRKLVGFAVRGCLCGPVRRKCLCWRCVRWHLVRRCAGRKRGAVGELHIGLRPPLGLTSLENALAARCVLAKKLESVHLRVASRASSRLVA